MARILVVEDEPLVQEAAACALRDAGFAVATANDAHDALHEVADSAFDALVTDIQMPGGLDGWALAEALRVQHPRLAVVYTSGFSSVDARPVEGSSYLAKPYAIAQLIAALACQGIVPTRGRSGNG